MSASSKVPYKAKSFTRGWKMSNNAKKNKHLNKGITAATCFYILWG